MLRLLLLAALSLPWTCARAQASGCTGETFVQVFRDEAGSDVRTTCVLPYPGGSGDLLVAGTVGPDLFFTRLGRDGALRWRRTVTAPGVSTELSTLAEVVIDPEGMIAGVGSTFTAGNEQRLYLIRYDPATDAVLYFRQPPWSSEGTGLALDPEGRYLVSGSRNGEPPPVFNAAFLARVDRTTGLVVGEGTTLDFRGDEGMLNLQLLPDGTAYCGGNVSATGGAGDTRASITRLEADGTPRWTRIGYAPTDVNARLFTFDVEVVGQTVYVLSWGNVGNITGSIGTAMILSAFGTDGLHRWTRRYDVLDFPGEEAVELVAYRDGLLAYGFGLVGERSPFLLHLGAEGEVRWSRTYDLPGSVVVYLRCNQQLLADDSGILLLGTYSGTGRPREGVLLQLDGDGRSANECLPVSDLELLVTALPDDWTAVDLQSTPQPAPWADVPSAPRSPTLAAFDDCDRPCDDCAERVLTRRAICRGASVLINGVPRSESAVYADTLPGAVAGCDSILLTELAVSDGPEVAVTVTRDCGFVTADVRLEVTGGEFPYRYDWSVPTATGNRASLAPGSYRVTVNDALGCNPTEVDVVVEPAGTGGPDFRFGGPFCPGDSTGFVRLEPPGSGSVRLLPDGAFIPGRIDGLAPGSYGVVLRDSTGCETFRQITIPEARPARILIEAPAFVRLGERFTLSARAAFGSLFSDYAWSAPDSLGCTNCPAPSLRPTVSGFVAVTARTERGCPVRDSVFLRVIAGPPRLYFPTGFSPNGDGVNERWVPGLGPETDRLLSLEVYDRWGNLAWSYPGSDAWWDGGPHPPGVYTYHAEVLLVDGRRKKVSGAVTLVR